MTKSEFLSQLSQRLRVLPESEQRDALEYYEGYISDAYDETAAIRELGSPGEVAATILSNYVSQRPNEYGRLPTTERRGGLKTAHIALIAIFAVPVGIPLAAAAFGLIIGLFAIIFSVAITGIVLLVSGVAVLISAPMVFFSDFWLGVMHTGLGFAALGLGILAFKGGAKLVAGFPAIMRLVRRRRTGVEESPTHVSDPQYANSFPPATHEAHDDYFAAAPPHRRIRSLRLAVLLFILGAFLFGGAWLNGARGGVIYWQGGRVRVASSHDRREEIIEMPVGNALDFHMVKIRATNANVVILPTDSSTTLYAGSPNVEIQNNDGVLYISQQRAGTNIYMMGIDFSPGNTREIRLYLPRSFVYSGGNIEIRTTTGSIRVEGGFTNLIATATSGRIRVLNNNAEADSIYLRTTTGRITVDNIHHANEITAIATSGRVEVSNIQHDVDMILLQTTSGSISAEDIPFVDTLYARATSGRVNIENISWAQLEARATSGRINIRRGSIYLTPGEISNTAISATSGAVRLDVDNNQDDFRLSLSSASGRMQMNGSTLANRGVIGSGSGANYINVSTTSGRINVNFD